GDLRQQLVAAHADERPDTREVHVPAVFAERLDPRLRVSIVAVDERAVDIEDDRAVHLRTAPPFAGLVAVDRLDRVAGRPPGLTPPPAGFPAVFAGPIHVAQRHP